MIIPDANVLIYAFNPLAPERESAREWLSTSLSGNIDFGFTWQTLTAFARISTDRRLFSNPYSTAEAFEIMESWLSTPRARVLVPTQNHMRIFSRLAIESKVNGPMLMDAHLAALAIEHGATLATTDRDFRRFDGLKLMNPLVKIKT